MLKSRSSLRRCGLVVAVFAGSCAVAIASGGAAQSVQASPPPVQVSTAKIIAPLYLDPSLGSSSSTVHVLSVTMADGLERHLFFNAPMRDLGVAHEAALARTPEPAGLRAAWAAIATALREHATRTAAGAPPQRMTPELQAALKLAGDYETAVRRESVIEGQALRLQNLAELNERLSDETLTPQDRELATRARDALARSAERAVALLPPRLSQ